MSQPAKAREPSMEEILASIRRIIADDDAGKSPSSDPPPDPSPAPPAPEATKPVRMSAVSSAKPSSSFARTTPAPASAPAPSAPAANAANSQDDIDALFATFDEAQTPEPVPEPAPSPPPLSSRGALKAASPPRPADILDLTEEMRTPPPTFRKVDARPDVVFTDEAGEADPAPDAFTPPRHRRPFDQPTAGGTRAAEPSFSEPAAEPPQLMSSTTKAAVDSAFNALAQTVLVQNARTLEDLVREMLRPMLKTWLDENLPQMVERLVRAEIERVSRGR